MTITNAEKVREPCSSDPAYALPACVTWSVTSDPTIS